ncbi:DUF3857 domain-containing protein [Flammeovirga sp. EKP202]|uniref:DUF3857 domain-containing protein n=1 Tax=Flammeovirga sp. EKP202 TaxID=2770592 RepID=UPI00165FD48B|nr:DUF3857 domain-containing protein [Flammeovirga sp. EKP202]MBD0400539.1 DUF3857 and transglutaminase domain-containing protein [Flammeovirga sp. EKP202]
MSKLKVFLLLLITYLAYLPVSFAQSTAVLSYDKEAFFDGKKKKTTYTYKVLIGDKENHELGDLSIDYSLGEDVVIHEASIYTLNGQKIRALKKKDFQKKNAVSDGAFHDDTYQMYASLKTNQYPHVLHFSYTITSKEMLYLAGWYPKVYAHIPTLKSSLTVKYPKDFPVRIKEDACFEYQEFNGEEYNIQKWSVKENLEYNPERNSPHIRNIFPVVEILPETISYGVDHKVKSWTEFGEWIRILNAGLDDLTAQEKVKIHALTDTLTDPCEKVKVLYNYLQDNTRYINVSLGIGGLKSHPASYVCENKYGDCKALTNYMQSMLSEIGIPSFMVDVYAGKQIKSIDTEFPSQQFNHVILGVVVDADTIFLENTSKVHPFNYLGSFTQNRKALWIEQGKSRLVDLPALTKENTVDSIAYTFSLADENEIRKVKVDFTSSGGQLFEALNSYKNSSDKKQEKVFRSHLLPFAIGAMDSMQIVKEDRNSTFITGSFQGECKRLEKKIASFRVITLPRIINTEIEKPSEREHPYWVNLVIHKKEHFEFSIDKIEQLKVELPKDFELKSKYGEYKDHYYIKEGKVCLDRSIYIKPNQISLEDYPTFYDFYKAIHSRSRKTSIIIKQQS